MGNGECSGAGHNSEDCGWDGGDYEEFNAEFYQSIPIALRPLHCHGGNYNTEECKWDGSDCNEFNANYPNCTVADSGRIGDGSC